MVEVDGYRPSVRSQAYVQRFEDTFLATPKKSEEKDSLRRGRTSNELLLGVCEVVGQEGIDAGFDEFEITTELFSGGRENAQGGAGSMTERDCDVSPLSLEKDFGFARRSG
jgi:hypothetical protein